MSIKSRFYNEKRNEKTEIKGKKRGMLFGVLIMGEGKSFLGWRRKKSGGVLALDASAESEGWGLHAATTTPVYLQTPVLR